MNEQNLIPNTSLSREEAKRLGQMGGKKSAQARAERKTFKEALKLALSMGDVQDKIIGAVLNKAFKGDTKAFEVIRDTIGEKPKEEVEMKVEGKLSEGVKEKIEKIIEECR